VAIKVELEITWVDGEAGQQLRAAQARVLRNLLAGITARRAPTNRAGEGAQR
jgi:hypothetical protein